MMRRRVQIPMAACCGLLWYLGLAMVAIGGEYLIRGGTVYDGTGRAGRRADVLIADGRIVAVGSIEAKAERVIDAAGLIVCPGFIDLHNHSDENILKPDARPAVNYLKQGVTTIVTGNCGAGHVDVAAYFRRLEEHGVGLNVAHLVPHGALRAKVMGDVNRQPTAKELRRMRRILERGLRAGACGLSTGLIYTPGCYAETAELIELARIVAAYDGLYASHIRGENAERLLDALHEAVRIGREAGVRVHISHFKASGPRAWGMIKDACALLEAARRDGLWVTADQYPYTASSTSVAAMTIPEEVREGGRKALLRRLDDPQQGRWIREQIRRNLEARGGPSTIMIASCKQRPEWIGKTIDQIACATGLDPVEVIVQIEKLGGASAVAFTMSEDDVRYAMKKPYVATASDGAARVPDATLPHPRSYGCFPRKIGRYAIQWRVLPVAQAIRSATGLPADILQLHDRGYLKPGMVADVVVFDPDEFRDHATFKQPHRYATGVRYLFVNGELVIDRGAYTKKLAGKPIRFNQRSKARTQQPRGGRK